MKFKSEPAVLNASQKKVFEFFTDFNNFEHLMPEQVTDWKSTTDSCSFDIKGMTSISLKYANKVPFHTIEVVPEGKAPINFDLKVMLEVNELDEQKTNGTILIDADLNPMMAMIAKRPFENLAKEMGVRLNKIF